MRDPRQPILKAIRCAISVKFGQEKEQREKGFENFVTEEGRKLPIIYMTDDIPEDWINYYQTMLNLPKSCFYVHRIRKVHGYVISSTRTASSPRGATLPMTCYYCCTFVNTKRDGLNGDETPFEINRLYDQVKEDVENPQKEPVIIIGTAGTESGLDDKV